MRFSGHVVSFHITGKCERPGLCVRRGGPFSWNSEGTAKCAFLWRDGMFSQNSYETVKGVLYIYVERWTIFS